MKNLIIVTISIFLLSISCEIPEPADITPPLMQIIYPNEGAVISSNFDIIINATDDGKVQKVWCYVNGIHVGESTSKPYSISYDISGLEKKRNYIVQAMAIDDAGNTGNSEQVNFTIADTPDLIPPEVTIINPVTGQVVENSVTVMAHATDDIGIKKVAFFIDGESLFVAHSYPYAYEWDTSEYSDSTEHTVAAKAFDTGGNTAISPVSVVTVYPRPGRDDDLEPPDLLFLYPTAGSTVSGTVDISVDILDASEIIKTEIYIDGQLTAIQNNPFIPWTYSWDTTPFENNMIHTIYVKATDAAGNTGSSVLLTVTVSN